MPAVADGPLLGDYLPIVILLGVAVFLGLLTLVLAHTLGPKRQGPLKDDVYESGVPAVGDARRRFNVRFYLVAMLFLLFDVEVLFLWPWAPLFRQASVAGRPLVAADGMLLSNDYLLVTISIFLVILLVGFVYEWRKGIFRWN